MGLKATGCVAQASLPEVLPRLTGLLETHFGAAMAAAQASKQEEARAHAAAVTAGLSAPLPHAVILLAFTPRAASTLRLDVRCCCILHPATEPLPLSLSICAALGRTPDGLSACAGAVEVYAQWAPLAQITNARLLAACTFLLSTPDFRMTACDILRQVAARKQLQVGKLFRKSESRFDFRRDSWHDALGRLRCFCVP